ncbi:hypothetical protein FO519_002616 [Halicephalobus sp. NKZ332]|nr:hypothetical protein FO519_002616 [Halicephalobus sp. NKZ332]
MGSRFLSKIKNSSRPLVFGMLHVPALPGTPLSQLSISEIDAKVRHEASIYSKTKIDGVILENMFDLPYVMRNKVGPEITASMTKLALSVKNVFDAEKKDALFGIQILAGANSQALAVAHIAGLDFVRAEGFVFAHIADEGFMNGCAGSLLRYKRGIGADNVAILADIKKKHSSHSITSDIPVGDTAHAAEFFLSDGIIITGNATGDPANVEDIREAKKSCSLPVFVGSGVTIENLPEFLEADGLIIGSYFKKDGDWKKELMREKVDQFMEKIIQA